MQSLPNLAIRAATLIALLGLLAFGGFSQIRLAGDDAVQPESETEDAPADSTQSTEDSPEKQAVSLLQDARHRLLHERRSVQAKLRETVSMGRRKFRGEGTYVAGPFPKLRLTLAINVGKTQGELLEVCDGTILWTVQQVTPPGAEEPQTLVARTVISDVTQALESTMDVPETFLIAGLGVGGLPALLAALERSMTFEAVRDIEEQGHTFTVIQGRWNDEYMQRMTGGNPDAQLPEFLPDHVRVYFDSQTMFPTRILYLRRTTPEAKTFVALLSLEFSDIVLDGPVDDELFQYTPGPNVEVRDRTGEYLKLIQEAADKERNDAAVRPDGSVPIGDQ